MIPVRLSLGTFAALAFMAGCGGSTSNGAPKGNGNDASVDDSSAGDSGGNPLGIMATCGALSGLTGDAGTCASGQTCCTTTAGLIPSSACVPIGQCMGVSNECGSPSDCTGGLVCCAGSADAGAFDVDAALPDASATNPLANFDPSTLSTTCQSSCTASQIKYCTTDEDCTLPLICQSFGAGFGFKLPSNCAMPLPDGGFQRPDGGTVVPDAGTAEDAGDTSPDAGE